jgi:integrase/recombinase XerD
MARGGMRIGEVLNLKPCDIQERSLTIQNPKSGRVGETVYVPRKILVRLNDYVKANDIGINDRIFPISYVVAWSMVKKAGRLVNIELRPHDLRRHAATYGANENIAAFSLAQKGDRQTVLRKAQEQKRRKDG